MSTLFCILMYYIVTAALCVAFYWREIHEPGMIDYYDNGDEWNDTIRMAKEVIEEDYENALVWLDLPDEEKEKTPEPGIVDMAICAYGTEVEDGVEFESWDVIKEGLAEVKERIFEQMENDHYLKNYAKEELIKCILTALIPFYRIWQLICMCRINSIWETIHRG